MLSPVHDLTIRVWVGRREEREKRGGDKEKGRETHVHVTCRWKKRGKGLWVV